VASGRTRPTPMFPPHDLLPCVSPLPPPSSSPPPGLYADQRRDRIHLSSSIDVIRTLLSRDISSALQPMHSILISFRALYSHLGLRHATSLGPRSSTWFMSQPSSFAHILSFTACGGVPLLWRISYGVFSRDMMDLTSVQTVDRASWTGGVFRLGR
jgi:hypothetical protein